MRTTSRVHIPHTRTTKTTSTKRRRPSRKAEDIHLVWKNQAPDALFTGKPLAELETALEAVQ